MRIRCADVDVAYEESGSGDPVLFIHGIGDDHRMWRRVASRLAPGLRPVAYDVRGFGGSAIGAADGTLRQLGDDATALLDALGIERADLVGFSMGGTIAMRAAIDHPDRIRSLVLVATSSRVGATAQARYEELARLARQEPAAFMERLEADVRRSYEAYPAVLAELLMIRLGASADVRGYANAATAMASLRPAPLDPELSQIAAPTLIVAGELDASCGPRAASIIKERIAHARLEIMAGTPHGIPVLRADPLAAAVARFVREETPAARPVAR